MVFSVGNSVFGSTEIYTLVVQSSAVLTGILHLWTKRILSSKHSSAGHLVGLLKQIEPIKKSINITTQRKIQTYIVFNRNGVVVSKQKI